MQNIVTRATSLLVLAAPMATAGELAPIGRADFRDLRTSQTYMGPSTVEGVQARDHLFDGIDYTPWVGAGPDPVSVTVDFIGTRYIGGIGIVPGCAGSNRTFAEFSRPSVLRLQAGERTVEVTVVDRRTLQDIVIDPPLVAQSVKLTVVTSIRGRNAGVCLSELELRELTALSGLSDEKREALEAHVGAFGDADKAKDAVAAVIALGPGALPRLSVALQSEQQLVRANALRALAAIGSPLAAEALLRFWSTGPKDEMRVLAVKALARCGDARVIPVLAGLMVDTDFDLADLAARALGTFGPQAVPVLDHALRSLHEDVRVRALRALAATHDPRALPLALPFVKAERSPLRAAAVRAIAGTRLPEAMGHLTAAATDAHPLVRLTVAKALTQVEGPSATALLAALMRDKDELVARIALNRMAKRSEGARQLAIYLGEPIAPLGDHAISLLASSHSPEALALMVDALRRGEQRYRSALRDGLRNFGERGLRAVLAGALSDSRLRVDAEVILGAAGAAAVPMIAEAMSRELESPPLFLIRAAGLTGDIGAVAILDSAWKSGQIAVRIAVMHGYGTLPTAAVERQIMAGLTSEDPAVRAEAAEAAGKAGVQAAVPSLLAALSTRSIAAEHVIEALSTFGDETAEASIVLAFDRRDSTMEVRLAALHACRRMKTPACNEMLTRAGSDRNPDLRAIALRMLALD